MNSLESVARWFPDRKPTRGHWGLPAPIQTRMKQQKPVPARDRIAVGPGELALVQLEAGGRDAVGARMLDARDSCYLETRHSSR